MFKKAKSSALIAKQPLSLTGPSCLPQGQSSQALKANRYYYDHQQKQILPAMEHTINVSADHF